MDVMKNLIAVQSWKQIDWEGVGEERRRGGVWAGSAPVRMFLAKKRSTWGKGRLLLSYLCNTDLSRGPSAAAQAPAVYCPFATVIEVKEVYQGSATLGGGASEKEGDFFIAKY